MALFCSVVTQNSALNSGFSGAVQTFVAFDTPVVSYASNEGLPEVVQAFIKHQHDALALRVQLLALVADPGYTPAGYRRIMMVKKSRGAFVSYFKQEYLVPEALFNEVLRAVLFKPASLADYADFLIRKHDYRDLMIHTFTPSATHNVQAYELFEQAKALSEFRQNIRIWRVKYALTTNASTLLELPSGRCWAHLGRQQLKALLRLSGNMACLTDCYKGWTALGNTALQTAEQHLTFQQGWSWLNKPKRIWIKKQTPRMTHACIEADGQHYETRVLTSGGLIEGRS